MIRQFENRVNILGKDIVAIAIQTDEGISVIVAGGDKSHIGASAIVSPSGDITTTTFCSHKETVVAEQWAKTLYERFPCPIVVSCGIHYDNISKKNIDVVLGASQQLLESTIDDITAKWTAGISDCLKL